MLSIAVLMLFIMLFAFCFKKGKKKLPPADVIPEVSCSNSFSCVWWKRFYYIICKMVEIFELCMGGRGSIEKFTRKDASEFKFYFHKFALFMSLD